MKHAALVAGTVVGAAAIVGGVGAQWSRVQPQFKVPEANIVLATPSTAELLKIQAAKQSSELQAILDSFSKRYPGQFGIVVKDLSTGASAQVAAEDQMVSASVYKLFVGWGVYKMVDAGQLTLNSKLKGTAQTIGSCLDAMITVSDNDCGYALGALVGWQKIDTDLAALGLTKTRINNYAGTSAILVDDKYTTARDVALFVEQLYNGKILSAASTQAYLNTLKGNKYTMWLAAGLPKGTVIAHKTGDLYKFVHDAGVVYSTQGDYIIVAMSRNWQDPPKQSPTAFADLSRQVWDYQTQ